MAAAWPGRTTFADLAARQLRRAEASAAIAPPAPGREPRLPDPGWARFRADGEAHLFAPKIATEITALATTDDPDGIDAALARYRGVADPRRGRPCRPARRAARPTGRGADRAR